MSLPKISNDYLMLIQLTSNKTSKGKRPYVCGSPAKGTLTLSVSEMYFFLSCFDVQKLPLDTCSNFYLLYLSCFTVYIPIASSTFLQSDLICIPVYSGDSLCETA
jgi:hypothetical protein